VLNTVDTRKCKSISQCLHSIYILDGVKTYARNDNSQNTLTDNIEIQESVSKNSFFSQSFDKVS